MQADRLENGAFLISCRINSTPEDVSFTLQGINKILQDESLSPPTNCSWELVVAEVLNNIVEHAYEEKAGGDITLELNFGETELNVEFTDQGLPMPGGAPPSGDQADLDVALEDMPEGGFGWFLIRSLSQDLDYRHDGARNRLTLTIPFEPQTPT